MSNVTHEQEEYFKNSIVRDEDGNLLKMYHGTPEVFREFDPSCVGQVGTGNGAGFNFTVNKDTAEHYRNGGDASLTGGMVLECYLNITKALHTDDMSLSKDDIINIIYEIRDNYADELALDEGDVIRYVDETFRGEHKCGALWMNDDVLLTAAAEYVVERIQESDDEAEYIDEWTEKNESVFDQYTEEDGEYYGPSADTLFYKAVENAGFQYAVNTLGYDGYVGSLGDNLVYTCLYPNQAKLTTNLRPTKNNDMFEKNEGATKEATKEVLSRKTNPHLMRMAAEKIRAGIALNTDRTINKYNGR